MGYVENPTLSNKSEGMAGNLSEKGGSLPRTLLSNGAVPNFKPPLTAKWLWVKNMYFKWNPASGNMDQNLWSPGGLILTHTQMIVWIYFPPVGRRFTPKRAMVETPCVGCRAHGRLYHPKKRVLTKAHVGLSLNRRTQNRGFPC